MNCQSECGRSFLTSEEKIAKLNSYKEWLELEKKGVEEAIEELRS